MVLPQWISTNRCLSEIVRNRPFGPLIICSLSVSQMKPLPRNICQIWVTMLKNSKYFHGNLLAGRNLRRSSPAPSLTAADITGERLPHLFRVSYLHLWNCEGVYYSFHLATRMPLRTTRSPSTLIMLILNEPQRAGTHVPSLP
jgi:hypothetical protein